MAGDWTKMKTDLYRHPKVCLIADALLDPESSLARYVNQHTQRDCNVTRNVMRNVTVGALVSVWGVLRHRGKRNGDDLVVAGCTLAVIDDIADLPGFGEAMAAGRWAKETSEGVVLPRFFVEMNVDPEEEARQKNAERQRKFRDKKRSESNVTVTLQSNVREEKRREENISNKSTPIELPENLNTAACKAAWNEWLAYKAERKERYKSAKTINAKLAALSKLGPDRMVRAIGFSIEQGYQGIFEPKGGGKSNFQKNLELIAELEGQ